MTKSEKKDEKIGVEEKYKALVETAADAIFTLDLLGRFTFVNPAAERIAGYSEGELVGKHFRELLPAKYIPACLNVFQKALRGQPTPPIEIELVTKEGERVLLELLGRPVKRGRRVVEIIAIARDITERKRAEEALKKSEERYKKQFAEAMDAIFIADAETGILVDCNRAALELVGREKSELIGKHQRILHPPEEIEGELSRTFKQHLKEKEGQILETQIITKEGEIKDVAIKASTFELEGQKVLLGIFRDITERKRAEQALRESEERFRSLFNNMSVGVALEDMNGYVLAANEADCRFLGYSQEEIVGMHFSEFTYPEDIDTHMDLYDAVVKGKRSNYVIDKRYVRKDGEIVWGRLSLSLIRDDDNHPRYTAIVCEDITERKRAEEALRESEEKYRNLIERANDGIVIIQDTIIRYANPRLAEMWGGTVQEFIGTPFTDYVLPDELPELIDRYKRRMAGEDVTPIYETVLRRKDGSKLYAELNAGIITYQGKPADLVIVRDIAERKRGEGEIGRHHDELAALNAIALTVTSTLDLQEVLRTIQERVVTLLAEKYPPVFGLFHEGNQTFEIIVTGAQKKALERAEKLLRVKFVELTFPLSTLNPTLREALLGGKPYLTSDGSDILGPQVSRRLVQGAQRVMGVNSIVDLPLWVKGKFVGAMVLLSQKERISEEEMELLSSIAAQAAIAIENARLYEAEQRRAEELAVLNEIGRAVSSVMHLDDLLELISQETSRVIDTSNLYIALYDEKKNEVSFPLYFEEGQRRRPEKRPAKLGLTEYVINSAKPLMINRDLVSQLKELNVELMGKSSKSWLGVPLLSGDRAIGVMAIQDYQNENAYDESHLRLLSAIANQAAIAIENAHLYEETQKRVREVTALHRVAEVVNATLDLKEIFQRVVEELSSTFGYRLVDIYLLEEDGLRLQANVGYDDKTTIKLIPLERGVVGRVARTGEPAFISDVTKDPDYIPAYPEIKSEICVPIKSGEALRGVLNVECDECRLLTEDDLLLLRTLSSHIGVAIENARLYEEEQRRSAERRTIAEVGRRAASILEMETLLSQVVDLIAENFAYDHVHIFQIDPDSEYAIYKAGTGKAGLAIAEEGLRLKVGEEGIIGWVAQHGESLLTNDVSLDPHYIPHPALPDTRSELAVPIRVGGRIIGILDVQSAELSAFDEGDLETLQTLADQLAVAIENARLYEETKRLAITDSLTGLYNLRYFYEMLEKEIRLTERYHRSLSLIILDIDDLKAYNDLYGHLAGDDLLIELAQLMSKVTRRADTSARYGGDEFAIILPETETEGAKVLAQRLLEKMKKHRFSTQAGQTIGRITTSLGIATYPHHADSAKALVDAADKALLRAKGAGKNQLFVCAEDLTEVEPR